MTEDNRVTDDTTTRRFAIAAGVLGLAAAGCSTYGGSSDDGGGEGDGGGNGAGGGAGGGATGGAQNSAGVLGKTSEVPVRGGKVFADQKVVVTQPAEGEFKAFSAVCTHRGCTVQDVADGLIDCPCHGSKFKIADASVVNGPATKPLPPTQITVSGGEIRLA